MTDPTTPNVGLIVPLTGAQVGAWGTAVINANMSALDGYAGGVLNLSLGAATTITLTTATATLTPSAGPYQSANSLIAFSGTLTGNQRIQVAQPGIYRFKNSCTAGTFYIQIAPSTGTGLIVGLPDGETWQVHFDGTNVQLLGLPHVATVLDFCVATTPAWMNAFTQACYLFCNGAVYSTSLFPTLAARLGSTFGGNGVTTFAVPDFQNRNFIPIDFGGNNRITVAGSGIDGTTFGAAGGSQTLQSHNHTSPVVTDPGHTHGLTNSTNVWHNFAGGSLGNAGNSGPQDMAVQSATTGITLAANVGTTGAGSSGNIPPGIVGGMRFIKT